jgi:hypothetical protein
MGDNKGEKQLMIVNKNARFDQDILAMGKTIRYNVVKFWKHTMEAKV